MEHSKDASPCALSAAREIGMRSAASRVSIRVCERDKADVDLKPEAKVLVFCIVSIERWRPAQASQVLEQVCVPEVPPLGSTVRCACPTNSGSSRNWLRYNVRLQNDSMFVPDSENSLQR